MCVFFWVNFGQFLTLKKCYLNPTNGVFFLMEKNGSKSLYFEENKMKLPYFLDNNFQHVINTW